MRDGGDAEAALRGDAALRAGKGERTHAGVHRCGAERARELAQPLRDELVEVDIADHLVLVRCDVLAVGGRADPDAVELGDLLLEGELGDERVDALDRRARRVLPWVDHPCGLLGGHPFTAPVRPPTMRFSARRKNSSAGIIARDV